MIPMIIFALLSIGTLYALIPIIVIVILILAARGSSQGEDFFAIFGIQTIINAARGIGGGGSGKGIRGPYKNPSSNKDAIKKAMGDPDSPGGAYSVYYYRFGPLGKNAAARGQESIKVANAIANMSQSQLLGLSKYYGLGASAAASAGVIANLVVTNLTLVEVTKYMTSNNIKPALPQGTNAPLSAPAGRVKMSHTDWYKTYYKTRKGNVRFTKPQSLFRASAAERAKGANLGESPETKAATAGVRRGMLNGMDENDLKGLFSYYGIKDIPKTANKDDLIKYADSALTASQVRAYLNTKGKPSSTIT